MNPISGINFGLFLLLCFWLLPLLVLWTLDLFYICI